MSDGELEEHLEVMIETVDPNRRIQEILRAYQDPERACRVCGCTNDRACPGGCSWVEPDLCSSCRPPRGGA